MNHGDRRQFGVRAAGGNEGPLRNKQTAHAPSRTWRAHLFELLLASLGSLILAARAVAAQGFSPEEAAPKMTVAPGIAVRLFAAEPMVRQPVAIEFDDRGRL
jgi:hypothetical protein